MYKLCIFAGTTEGRALTEWLSDQPVEVTACVATEYGETLLSSRKNLTVSAGRLTQSEMSALLLREQFDLVIDATHPYASEVTENIAAACEAAKTEYLRLLRDSDASPEGAVCVPDTESAVQYLQSTQGNILLTTGSKELSKYTALPEFSQRVYARVLPMESSLESCRSAGLSPDRIIAMQGPFSRELNAATLRAVSARYMVTKDTGKPGGFIEKAAAARDTGAILVVVGRPPQREGLDFAGTTRLLTERWHLHPRPHVTLAGIGLGTSDSMTSDVIRAIREADCVIGAKRMLSAAIPGQRVQEAIAPDAIAACIREHPEYRRFTVVFSGDSGFYSGAKKLLPLLTDCDVTILPGISSLQALCSRLQTSYEDIIPLSLHGRDQDIIPDIRQNHRVFTLVGGPDGMSSLCRALTEAGLGAVRISTGERLGYPEERITTGTAQELSAQHFDPLCAALIENDAAQPFTPGLPDECFQRGQSSDASPVPMTKREVRACILSQLALTSDAVCWDIGAGTGSVSIEMALLSRKGTVWAVEKNPAALTLLEENRARFHTSNLQIVSGAAPEACIDLPSPTHVFIGGSSGNMREIITLALSKNPSVRIVVSAIALESVSEMTYLLKSLDFLNTEVTCLNASHSRKAGPYHLMLAQNPVYLFTLQHREAAL